MLWPWRLFLRSNYPTKKNSTSCNDWIDSGSGAPWMRNVLPRLRRNHHWAGNPVIGSIRGNWLLRIICPTEHWDSMPMEWVRPTDEVLIKIAMPETERHWIRLIIRAGRATQIFPSAFSLPSYCGCSRASRKQRLSVPLKKLRSRRSGGLPASAP